MAITGNNFFKTITLTKLDDSAELFVDQISGNIKEFLIREGSVFGEAGLKIARKINSDAIYTPIKDNDDITDKEYSTSGAGFKLDNIVRYGSVKFYLENADDDSNVIIDIAI